MTEEIKQCYRALDLEPGATPAEVKAAWRELVKVWHPDRFPNDTRLKAKGAAKLRDINRAYEILEAHLKPQQPSQDRSTENKTSREYRPGPPPKEQKESQPKKPSKAVAIYIGAMIVGSLFIGLDVLRVSLAEKREEEKQQAIAIKATRASEEVERLRLAATLEQQKKDEEAKVQKQKQELIDVSRRLATLEQQAARAAEKAADDAKLLAAAQERERQLLATAAAAEPKRVPPPPPPPSGRAAVSVSGERAVPLAAQRSLSAMGIDMIACAGGTFSMGSTRSGSGEQPVTTVTLSPFWLAKTEVTQAQWEALMGSNPSHFKGGQLPVENVSWGDAMEFCWKLTERERQAGRLPTGTIYTLPTEAQWEYACRAGTTGDYAGEVDAMAWHTKNSGAATHAVGTKQANAWGLHDMHGNVWERCLDWYGPYSGGRVTDPKGALSGSLRVVRGGSWHIVAYGARSAYRSNVNPDYRVNSIGFRPALSSVP